MRTALQNHYARKRRGKRLPRYVVIAADQYGAPRAWGASTTEAEALAECQKQVAAYRQERPDLQLTIRPAIVTEGQS